MVRVPSPSRAFTRATLLSRASRSTSTQAGRSEASRSSTPGAASGAAGRRRSSSSEGGGAAVEPMPVQVAEGSRLADEHHLHRAGLAIAVLRDDQLGEPLVLVGGIVDFIAID